MKKLFVFLVAAMLLSLDTATVQAQSNVGLSVLPETNDIGRGFVSNLEFTGLYSWENYMVKYYSGTSLPLYTYQGAEYIFAPSLGSAVVYEAITDNIDAGTEVFVRVELWRMDQNMNQTTLVAEFGDNLSISHTTGVDETPLVIIEHNNPDDYHSMDITVKIVPRSTHQFAWSFCSRNPAVSNSYDEDWMGPIPVVPGDTLRLDTAWSNMEAYEFKDVGARITSWEMSFEKTDMTSLYTNSASAPIVSLREESFNGSNTIIQGDIIYQGAPTTTDFRVTSISSGMEIWTDGPVARGVYSGVVGEQVFNLTPGEEYLIELFAWNDIDSAVAATTITVPANLLGIGDEDALVFSWYPNPAKDHLVIEAKGEADLAILDLSGKILWEEPILIGTNRVDLQLPSGVYFLDLLMENNRKTEKFIVQ